MKYLILVFTFASTAVCAQFKAIVYLKDKPHQESFALSKLASERRAKSGVFYDNTDFPVNTDYVDQIKASGVTVIRSSKWMNALLVESKQRIDWGMFPFVSKVELIEKKKHSRSIMSTEVIGRETAGFSDKNFKIHNGKFLADHGYTGKGMRIALFDDGFQGVDTVAGFAKLRNEGRIAFTKNYIEDSSIYRYDQHGTQTLSVMAGYLPGQFMGTAVDATYFIFVTENFFSETPVEEFNWAAAAETADSLGADVISSSLGYTDFNDPYPDHTKDQLDGRTTIVSQAAILAARKGILVVNSAGNYGSQFWRKIGPPADADSILAVGAVKVDSTIGSFSSMGPTADGRLKPEVVSLGVSTAVIRNAGELAESNGTSFACPIIAGLSASLWQSEPQLSNMEIRQIVMASGDRYGRADTIYGNGIPNFGSALGILKGYQDELVYPNPSSGNLFLETGALTGIVDFKLYSSIGQLINSTTIDIKPFTRLELNGLVPAGTSTGTYFLSIKSEMKTRHHALIIQ